MTGLSIPRGDGAPSRLSTPGLVLVAIMLAFALVGPALATHDPIVQNLARVLEAPSMVHLLGTDHLGRDVFSRLAHGAPRTLGLALLCVAGAGALGVALGVLAAYGGRLADALVMRLADLMLAFPGILLALIFAGLLGGGILPMLIGITLTLWPQFARMSRAVAVGVLQEAHVEAAQLAGFPARTILLRHVLRPVLRQTVILATLGLGTSVMSISSLGFLGLGLQPPVPEWGAMISETLPYLSEAPIQMAAPCLAIFLAVLGMTLLGRAYTETRP